MLFTHSLMRLAWQQNKNTLYLLVLLQNLEETADGHDVVTSVIMQLSAEKLTNYGIFLLDYGMVSNEDNSSMF